MIDKKELDDLLARGVGEFIDPDGAFRKKLESAPEKIVIKFGIDPTRPDIHLGHAVVLHKLRKFQDLGCKVIFLAGDFTALIGDPTGKSKIRPEVSQLEVSSNMETYVKQIPKILKIEPLNDADKKQKIIRDSNNFIVDSPWFGWMRNSDWFFNVTDITSKGASKNALTLENEKGKLEVPENSFIGKAVVFEKTRMQTLIQKNNIRTTSLINFMAILGSISHSQLIERDMFQDRIKKGEPLSMKEMLYPVAQGIDSNILSDIYGSCDLEVGGTDQTFNMLLGRRVMEISKKNEIQAVLAFKLLEGTDGKEKMSKSLDNYIGITDLPGDMYGKVMSIPDSSIPNYFELCTFTPLPEVEKIKKQLEKDSINPKDLKMDLAKQIVAIYYGEAKAAQAEENFVNTFQKGEIPEDLIELKASGLLMDTLVKGKIVASNSEFRRLVEEGAITDLESGDKIADMGLVPAAGQKFKIGKKRFVKVV